MQQGLVINLAEETRSNVTAHPVEISEETLAKWMAGHKKADITLTVREDDVADDATFELIETVIAFIHANPAKSKEWKARADSAIAAQDE